MNTQKKANTVQIIAYGTLMTGERNHCFCRNAVSIRPCVVTGTLYDTGYGFPAYMPAGSTQVKAELMEIPMEDWAAVDRLEGYPRLTTGCWSRQRWRTAARLKHGCTS